MMSRQELIALRERWRLLCEPPHRNDLAAEVAASLERELELAHQSFRAAAAAPQRARAIGQMIEAVLILQLTRDRAFWSPGPSVFELRERLSGAKIRDGDTRADETNGTGVEVAAGVEAAPSPETDPFLPWRLETIAEDAPDAERAALLDRAVDLFDEIVPSPRSPGNDLGPFTRSAYLMSEPQVRRALAIVDRMDAAGWGLYDVSGAREALVSRLASLGRTDDAEAWLRRIEDGETHAHARGRIIAHRTLQGGAWTSIADPCLRTGERLCLYRLLEGITEVLVPPERTPPLEAVEECLALACAHPDEHERNLSLRILTDLWGTVGPVERWIWALREHATGPEQVGMLLQLADHRRASDLGPAIARLALQRVDLLPQEPTSDWNAVSWLDEVFALRDLLGLDAVGTFFADILRRAVRGRPTWLLQDFSFVHGLVELLRWLGGDECLAEVLSALDDVTWFFAP